MRPIRIATRGSEQAMAQTSAIAERLRVTCGVDVELVTVQTSGDRDKLTPLAQLGGRGVFVKEVQQAVIFGDADIAVHSAKDLPSSWTTDGLVLASIPKRGNPFDALVGMRLEEIREGGTIATGSVRREAQLAAMRNDLKFVGLRGNIPARVAKADRPEIDAVVVAIAGVEWIQLDGRIAQRFTLNEMIPQVGQGALAIECRTDDHETREALQLIEDERSRRAVDCERAFLAHLGGGCDVPVVAAVAGAARSCNCLVRGFVFSDRVDRPVAG